MVSELTGFEYLGALGFAWVHLGFSMFCVSYERAYLPTGLHVSMLMCFYIHVFVYYLLR